MTKEQKNEILQQIQTLVEESITLGRLAHEDDQDPRSPDQRGSTHELREELSRKVYRLRLNLEVYLTTLVQS